MKSIDLPDTIRYSGIFLVVLGILIFITGLLTIKALESYDGDLITHGIYSKIRHPMYLGFILWLIGSPVFYGGLISFVLCIVFLGNVLFWRHLEEIELGNRFPAYKDYKKKTIF
jgi:protein-S-isoprenylcysteine O-methyltransferase Ste14